MMPDQEPCAKCGAPHVRTGNPTCVGHKKNPVRPCLRYPLSGLKVCTMHGGATPNAKKHAAMVTEERRARSMLERLEQPEPIEHPVYELLKLAAETIEWQRILRERLDEIQTMGEYDQHGVERERAIVLLYERALVQTGKLLVDMAKLDLQSKALALQQGTAAKVMDGVVTALHRVGLGEHEPAIRAALADVFREMRGADDRLPLPTGRPGQAA